MPAQPPNATQNSSPTRRQLLQAGGWGLACLSGLVQAQPDTTKLTVPFAPGASNDLIARLLAESMSRQTQRTWIVENKPGAGSLLGAEVVARSVPDGRSLLLCASANMGIQPAIRKTMRYDVESDFTFLARVTTSPFALVVNTNLGAPDFQAFVRLAKAKPGSVRVGSAGVGSLGHMGAYLMQSLLGVGFNNVPYKGAAQVLNDLRAGHIDASLVSPGSIAPLLKEGGVKVLAVLDKQRNSLLPDVPASPELGQPKLVVVNWWGVAGPAKLPPAMTASLSSGLEKTMADPAFGQKLKDLGLDPAPLVGAAFAQFVSGDLKAWKAVAQQANITLDEQG